MNQTSSDETIQAMTQLVAGLNALSESSSKISDLIYLIRFDKNSEEEITLRSSYLSMMKDIELLTGTLSKLFEEICNINSAQYSS